VNPVPPVPAATVVLLRDAPAGPEVLLLRRHRASGFVPGAYVFPGGRVDEEDAQPGLEEVLKPPPPEPPLSYWAAAVREAFEETGVLLARERIPPELAARLAHWRGELLENRSTLLELLTAESLSISLDDMTYFAHWITPEAEPRRYDTRFFLARVHDQEVQIDAREMTDSVWLTPAAALDRFARSALPMVFPTVKTLERLRVYPSVSDALAELRKQKVTAVMPTFVRTIRGLEIVVNEEQENNASNDTR
jgi:8-oxo-dGTP pyrophosphatase MutT (NUDIX family)